MNTIKLNEEEIRLILSALGNDRVGTWGDKRHEAIARLVNKIKRQEKEIAQ
jgi:hypothetical protein